MKKTLFSLVSGFALLGSAWQLSAAPLERPLVPADVKWLLHLDVDALRQSRLGSTLIETIKAEAAEGLKRGMNLDVAAVIEQTGSLTACGSHFEKGPDAGGVLMWRGGQEIERIVTALLIQQAEASKAGEGKVKAVTEGPEPVYSVDGRLFVIVRSGRAILASQRLGDLETALQVLDGKAPSLADRETFSEYKPLPGGFFLLALAENFAKNSGLPAQAQVLKLAEGGRVALGEEEQKLTLSVNLKTGKPEDATQIQQVFQGLVALASLAQVKDPELAKAKEWIHGTAVTVEENVVGVDLSVPVEAVLRQLELRSRGKVRIDAAPEHGSHEAKPDGEANH